MKLPVVMIAMLTSIMMLLGQWVANVKTHIKHFFSPPAVVDVVETPDVIVEKPIVESPIVPKESMDVDNSFAGTIVGMTMGDSLYIMLENADGARTEFYVSVDTYVFDDVKIMEGEEVVAYYEKGLITPAIYPPRYTASVIAPKAGPASVFVGLFDDKLLSTDGNLKLHIGDDTKIITKDGKAYTGSLANERLAVVYAIMTMSIPAQTTPSLIVVLPQEVTTSTGVSKMPIIVEGKEIKAPAAYRNSQDVIMVPVKEIVEALDYTFNYDKTTGLYVVGKSITFEIGNNSYSYGRMAPIVLDVAPEEVDGIAYVPFFFFSQVMHMNNAYIFEGQIVIDNNEKME